MSSSKRKSLKREEEEYQGRPYGGTHQMKDTAVPEEDDIEFDDPFEDVYEEEVIVNGDDMNDEDDELGDEQQQQTRPRVWRHDIDGLQPGEKLVYDPAAYSVYETATLEWPSLSFDILPDPQYQNLTDIKYPLQLYVVCGTQTDGSVDNQVHILKMQNIHKDTEIEKDDGFTLDENEEDDDEATDYVPVINAQSFTHPGCVNRIRAMPQNPTILSTWSSDGDIHIWNATNQLSLLTGTSTTIPNSKMAPLYSYRHPVNPVEGYGMAWSTIQTGRLATGDCAGNIHLHQLNPDGSFSTQTHGNPYSFFNSGESIEDIQWSPNQRDIFATVDTGGYLGIWHAKGEQRRPRMFLKAHNADVNVLSWNPIKHQFILTGADDGEFCVWDMRYLKDPVAHSKLLGATVEQAWRRLCDETYGFNALDSDVMQSATGQQQQQQPSPHPLAGSYKWHKKAITSIQWSPHVDTMCTVSSEDNCISVWDLAVEADLDEVAKEATGAELLDAEDYPGQILFTHFGQEHVKEIHYHPQIRSLILSTASNGIDIFKPVNLDVVLPAVDEANTIEVD